MEASANPAVWIVLVGGVAQTIYYTVLIILVAARMSSRLAVMEFKVNELWKSSRAEIDGV